MNDTRVFDRAAGFYDQTRLLPDEVATAGLDALLEVVGPGASLLEAGIGTGRIGVPLWQRGADLTGVDLSLPMMARLREKYPPARLAQADVRHLPFGAATFDAVLTVHVLHLMRDWQGVLAEFRRVLHPGGALINAFSRWGDDAPRNRLRTYWGEWLRENDPSAAPPFLGVRDDAAISNAYQQLGATVFMQEAAHYQETYRLDEAIDLYARRIFSSTWEVGDVTLAASVAALNDWVIAEYGSLDHSFTDDITFYLQIGRFPG